MLTKKSLKEIASQLHITTLKWPQGPSSKNDIEALALGNFKFT